MYLITLRELSYSQPTSELFKTVTLDTSSSHSGKSKVIFWK